MPAHLRPIIHKCNAPGCGAVAKHALYNTYNSHLGDYCTRHAKARLAEMLGATRKPAREEKP